MTFIHDYKNIDITVAENFSITKLVMIKSRNCLNNFHNSMQHTFESYNLELQLKRMCHPQSNTQRYWI